MYAFQISLWSILGIDNQPRTTMQTFLSSCGLFLGAVINANIFGELAMVMASTDKEFKRFQFKITQVNTVMLTLELPFEL